MKRLAGLVYADGYNIVDRETGDVVYSAGNSFYDSQVWLAVDDPAAVSIETLQRYCDTTGEEMAEEKGIVYLGHTSPAP